MSTDKKQQASSELSVESPCIRNCCLDDNDICLGCFRHLDEITTWQQLDNSGKTAVLAQCQQRKDLRECQ